MFSESANAKKASFFFNGLLEKKTFCFNIDKGVRFFPGALKGLWCQRGSNLCSLHGLGSNWSGYSNA